MKEYNFFLWMAFGFSFLTLFIHLGVAFLQSRLIIQRLRSQGSTQCITESFQIKAKRKCRNDETINRTENK